MFRENRAALWAERASCIPHGHFLGWGWRPMVVAYGLRLEYFELGS